MGEGGHLSLCGNASIIPLYDGLLDCSPQASGIAGIGSAGLLKNGADRSGPVGQS